MLEFALSLVVMFAVVGGLSMWMVTKDRRRRADPNRRED